MLKRIFVVMVPQYTPLKMTGHTFVLFIESRMKALISVALLGFCVVCAGCTSLISASREVPDRRVVNTMHGPLALAVKEQGQGRPILLLHGLGTSSFTWASIMPGLARSHRVIALDLRGFGASDKPMDTHYRIADQADAVRAFIEQENLRDLTIIGHSFGGGITLALALSMNGQPRSRLRDIVLIDTVAYRQPIPIFFRIAKLPVIGDLGMSVIPPELQAEQGLRMAYYDRSKISQQAIAEYAAPLYSPEARHAFVETVSNILPPDIDEVSERYKALKMPTKIMWCEEDKIIPVALGIRLHENIPGADLTVLKTCGHLPQEERPVETLGAIEGFINRAKASR